MKDKIYRVVIILEMLAILCIISKENDIKEEIDMGKKLRTVPIYAEIAERIETGIETVIEMADILDAERLEAKYGGHEDLSMWVGKYSFFEKCLASNQVVYLVMGYDIEIYQDVQGKYCADVKIDGYQTGYFFRADVYGNSEEIHLYFKESLRRKGEVWCWPITINQNEEIMSFVRNENTGNIYTTLGQLEGSELLKAGGIELQIQR